ncbi:MAG: hypothetical protein FJX52_04145 [Alphaproteobacteria bacterium]|nr:hypothetical protein [Alphaproteobacteria bacterium]
MDHRLANSVSQSIAPGTAQTYSGGGPGAGIKGLPQPMPSALPGWNNVAKPELAAAQLPVAVAPDQIPAAMARSLEKYEQMRRNRIAQGERVNVLN